ncbi:MAG: hypothetical protein C4560_11975 [Nitrospiraceae bacterium]|nr:MAG: hypothetical protein C4560_11975 [Nitrospiraceae bacterium]
MKDMMKSKRFSGKSFAWLTFILSLLSLAAALPAVSFAEWNTSTIDSTGNVGSFTSIAEDSNGKTHIGYLDEDNNDLKYATNASGSWTASTIDSSGNVGTFTSIAIDSNNKAHISYYDGYPNYDLKYATNASGEWITSVIDGRSSGDSSSIAIDSNNNVHISYYAEYPDYDLNYATNASGDWVTSTLDSAGNVGFYASIVVNSTNNIHISYYDWSNGDLKYATNIIWTPVSGTWAMENDEYSGTDTAGPFGISLLNNAQTSGSMMIESDLFSRPDGTYLNGLIIFDYNGPNDFKYAAAKDGANLWVIGYSNGDGSWHDIASFSENIDTSRWYRMRVEISGNTVNLYVDDDRDGSGFVFKAGADFSSMGTGQIGLGVRWSHAHFDNFSFGTLPSDAGCSSSDVLCVPAEHSTIQSAVDAALDGDAVRIAQGTYYESINIAKGGAITLEGGWDFTTGDRSDDPALTIIDGSGTERVFYIDPADADLDLTIKGLTIQNGSKAYGDGQPAYNIGSGLLAINNNPYRITLTLLDNVIKNNLTTGYYADAAVAIMAKQENITAVLRGNEIHNNHADADSGGVLLINYTDGKVFDVTMDGNNIHDNTSSFGAGVMLFSDGRQSNPAHVNANIVNNIISNNYAEDCFANADFGGPAYGGGLSVITRRENTADIILEGNMISGNQAVTGAGLFLGVQHWSGCTGPCDARTTLNSSNNTITGNEVPSACSAYANVSNGGGVSINIDPDMAQTSDFNFNGDVISGNGLYDLILEADNRSQAIISISGTGIDELHQYGSRSYDVLCPENGNPLYYRPCILTYTGVLIPD